MQCWKNILFKHLKKLQCQRFKAQADTKYYSSVLLFLCCWFTKNTVTFVRSTQPVFNGLQGFFLSIQNYLKNILTFKQIFFVEIILSLSYSLSASFTVVCVIYCFLLEAFFYRQLFFYLEHFLFLPFSIQLSLSASFAFNSHSQHFLFFLFFSVFLSHLQHYMVFFLILSSSFSFFLIQYLFIFLSFFS